MLPDQPALCYPLSAELQKVNHCLSEWTPFTSRLSRFAIASIGYWLLNTGYARSAKRTPARFWSLP